MNRRMALAVVPAASLFGVAALTVPTFAQITYSYDTGVTTTAVGPPNSFPSSPVMGWGNYFTAPVGGDTITKISVAFGPTWPNKGPVTVWLMSDNDNDNDPRNAVPLVSATLTPTTIGGSVFTDFVIPPTFVSSSFFVLVYTNTVKGQDRPAAQDATVGNVQNKSWLFYNPVTSGLNVANLGANALARRTDDGVLPFRGPWMVRATGIPAPASAGLLALGGIALTRRRR